MALVIRIIFLLLGHYLISLPDTTADAITYEGLAWKMGQGGFFSVLYDFEISTNQFISWLIAIPYSLFGRSLLMAKSVVFPSNEQMIYDTGTDLKRKLKAIIAGNKF